MNPVMTSCQGLEDLRNGIIRTPLPPWETFMDDPLRVLRCIRFASRFGFELVPELREAARAHDIQVRLVLFLFIPVLTKRESWP